MAATTSKNSTAIRIVIIVISVLGAGLLCFGGVMIFGTVYGAEICPDTLERRYYYYREIPLIGWQVQSAWHLDQTGALEKHLAADNLIKPGPAKKNWHVIHISRGLAGIRRNDPEILVRYLDAKDSNQDFYWLEWTKKLASKDPQLAKQVWQGVVELAVAGEYTTIPDLLELAQTATDPVKAQAEIKTLVQQATQPPPTPAPLPAEMPE